MYGVPSTREVCLSTVLHNTCVGDQIKYTYAEGADTCLVTQRFENAREQRWRKLYNKSAETSVAVGRLKTIDFESIKMINQ